MAPLPTHRAAASARPYTHGGTMYNTSTKWSPALKDRAAELWAEGLDNDAILSALHDESEEFRRLDENMDSFDCGFSHVRNADRDRFPARSRSQRNNGANGVRTPIRNVK